MINILMAAFSRRSTDDAASALSVYFFNCILTTVHGIHGDISLLVHLRTTRSSATQLSL